MPAWINLKVCASCQDRSVSIVMRHLWHVNRWLFANMIAEPSIWLYVLSDEIQSEKNLSYTVGWLQPNATGMSLLLIVGPKCTLAASPAAPWWVTVSMPTGQTGRWTDIRTDARQLHYAFPYGCGQRNKTRKSSLGVAPITSAQNSTNANAVTYLQVWLYGEYLFPLAYFPCDRELWLQPWTSALT